MRQAKRRYEMIRNINERFGERLTFATVEEMTAAIEAIGYLPEDGLVEGRDYETLTKGEELIESLKAEDFDTRAIADALCDGAYLETLAGEYTQEDIEEAYSIVCDSI
jgi:hypothetical protein